MAEESGRAWSVISFRGPNELAERIDKAAKRRGVTKAVVQREAIEMYLLLAESNFHLAAFQPVAFQAGTSSEGE